MRLNREHVSTIRNDAPIFLPSKSFAQVSKTREVFAVQKVEHADFHPVSKSRRPNFSSLSLSLLLCFIASRPCFRHVETKLAGFVLEARSSDTGKINYCPPPRAPLRSPWKRSFFEDTRVENPIFRTRPAVPIRGSMGRLKLRII